MADEKETQIEEVKEEAGGAGSEDQGSENEATETIQSAGSGLASNPWVPVLVVIVVLPILSFLMAEFILIPRIQSAVNSGNDEQVAQKAEEPKDGTAAEGEGKKGGAVYTYNFDNIVGNLTGSLQSRYLKVSFTVEGHSRKFGYLMEANHVKIVDATLGLISSLTVEDLEKPGFKNILRNEMLTLFETTLGEKVIEQIYFSEFVVQ